MVWLFHISLDLRLGDSYVNELLAIIHEIYKPFDNGFEVRRVFCGMIE